MHDWFAWVSSGGWIILTDEEITPLCAYLVGAGFSVVPRAAARGVRRWEITRTRPM